MNSKAFREIPAPAKKADYVGKDIFLREDSPADQREVSSYIKERFPDRPYRKNYAARGDVVRIVRRLNAKDTINGARDVYSWGNIRILDVQVECTTCGTAHRDYIPESWIDEGKVVFVERYSKEDV